MPTSQNGYPANDESLISTWEIGKTRRVRLKRGDVGEVLKHFADWFDAHVEDIDQGADDWGYAERTIRGDASTLSNHASGTALDLNATRHPLGKRGTFTPRQTAAIRQQLKAYDGVIRWGGDYVNRADEMHFEIDAPLAEVSVVARKLRQPLPPTRITRARDLVNQALALLAEADEVAGPARKAKIATARTALRAVKAALPKR